MSPRPNSGAIEDFDLVRFGGPTKTAESGVQVPTTSQQIVQANPDRVLLILTNNGPNTIRWSTKSDLTATRSQQLANAQTMTLQVQDDGALTGSALWGFADAAASELNILEVIRQRKG